MSWEAVTPLSAAFTGVVIAITAVAALRQARIGVEQSVALRDQLEHLRKATQFEGVLAVFAELDSPLQVEARHFVQFELADRLKEEKFHLEVSAVGGADEREHKEITVLRCFERIGIYARKGYVDPDVVCMVASGRVIVMWRALEEVVAVHRSIAGPFWINFEQLYHDCRSWMREHDVRIDDLEAHQVQLSQRDGNESAG